MSRYCNSLPEMDFSLLIMEVPLFIRTLLLRFYACVEHSKVSIRIPSGAPSE